MYVPFDTLKDSSRLWIFQSSREFTPSEVKEIERKLQDFVEEWTRHGDDLKGSYRIVYDHFIILAVDESFATVSGCSIDASTHLIKNLENEFQIDLLNKLNTAFRHGEHLNIVSLGDFQRYVEEGKIVPETTVFNNMVQTKSELETLWEIPANKSWHKRYF